MEYGNPEKTYRGPSMHMTNYLGEWLAILERSDLSATSTDLSSRLGGHLLPDKSVEVADKSDLYRRKIPDVDRESS